MPADIGCTPAQKKIKLKIAIVGAATKILVGLFALAGVALGVWGQVKSGDTNAALKDTVTHVKVALPQVRSDVDKLQAEVKLLAGTIVDLREKVAMLEGQLKGHTPHWLLGGRGRPAAEEATAKGLAKVISRDKPKALPTLEIRQFAQEE